MYRKFKADQIFTGYKMLDAGDILVTETDGTIVDIIQEKDAGEDVQHFDGILVPGFINCHCHLELSHLKGLIPKHTGLVDFVFKVITERHFEEAAILDAIEKAAADMYRNGIVAVGDICNNTLTITEKQQQKIWYHNFIELAGFPPAIASKRFEKGEALYNSFIKTLPNSSIVPHAPYSVSGELFALVNTFKQKKIISIHNQEIAAENELYETGSGDFLSMYKKMNIDLSFFKPSGQSSLQVFLPYFNQRQNLLLVHNVATTKTDIAFAKEHAAINSLNIFYCFCPNANLYISNLLPDIKLFTSESDQIVLGTDSLASNDQLSVLAEAKTLRGHFPDLEWEILLQWATINGARALGIDDRFGSFEKGKQPGIVFIEKDFSKAHRVV